MLITATHKKNTIGITDGAVDFVLELTCLRGVSCRWRG
jgi:hypothetical protein